MIRKLRRKMILLVLLSLFVIMCLFVGSINLLNWQNLVSQAESSLELLAANQGTRPLMEAPSGTPPAPFGEESTEQESGETGETETDVTEAPESGKGSRYMTGWMLPAHPAGSTYRTVTLSMPGPEMNQGNQGGMGFPPSGSGTSGQMPWAPPSNGTEGTGQMPEGAAAPMPGGEGMQMPEGSVPPMPGGEGMWQMPDGTVPPRPETEGKSSEATPDTSSTDQAAVTAGPRNTPPQMRREADRGQPVSSRESIAGLSNYYTITLSDEGTVAGWTSDREDLYSDNQIEALTEQILATGQEKGHIGSQFFLITQVDANRVIIVLDERIEVMRAEELLRNTLILGALVWLVLGAGAVLVIRGMFVPVEEAARKQKEFVWDASHELKTPIAVISANAEVLEREYGKNQWLGYIRSELERTTQLVQSLLELARTDRETTRAQMKDFDLSHAVMAVALPFESTVFENGRTMEMDIQEDLHMTGAEEMIQRLVVILLSNAVKYSEPGGTIRLGLKTRGRNRVLSVHNTGSYIAREDQTRIFDRFYRVDSAHSREVEGHGLGLAIAKNIVETHGGRIHVESSRDTGTTFEAVF